MADYLVYTVERYLGNFVNGVFLHFTGICIYAWLHRPFHFYTHTRYPGVFHTVTSSAVYDCFVLVLALLVYKKIVFTKYYFNFINLIKSDWKTFFHF